MKDKFDPSKKSYNYNFYQDSYSAEDANFLLCDIDRTNKLNMPYEIY